MAKKNKDNLTSDKKQARQEKKEIKKTAKAMIPATEQEEGGPIMKPDAKKAKSLTKAIGGSQSEKQQRKRDIKELGYDPSHPLEKAERRPARNINTQGELVKSAPEPELPTTVGEPAPDVFSEKTKPSNKVAEAIDTEPIGVTESVSNVTSDNIVWDDMFKRKGYEETEEKLTSSVNADQVISEEMANAAKLNDVIETAAENYDIDGTPKMSTGRPVEEAITQEDINNAQTRPARLLSNHQQEHCSRVI
jgi:hypothetical protein